MLAHLLNGLLMVAIPVLLAIYLTCHWKMGGRVWWIGAATFIISQVGHIPFNWGVWKVIEPDQYGCLEPDNPADFQRCFPGIKCWNL